MYHKSEGKMHHAEKHHAEGKMHHTEKHHAEMHHAAEDTMHKSSSMMGMPMPMMGMPIAVGTGVGTSIFMLAGFVAFVLVIVGIVKSQKIVKESIGDPSKVATMVIMGMVAALLVGLPGVNIVLASIFMHMVRTIDK